MKEKVREHISQLDLNNGGGIISKKIRVPALKNPALIVGIGGTGIDALLRLKHQVNRRFELPEDPLTKKLAEKPHTIEYLAFDTDQKVKNNRMNGIGLDSNSEFVELTNSEIGRLLSDRSQLGSHITEWLSPELSMKDGTNGAEGIRQAGRLLLFIKLDKILAVIRKKITQLLTDSNEKMYIFILSGISGGTGSGCFLDISYMIRGYLEREGLSERAQILGYLYTPDVNMNRPGIDPNVVEYITKNGYAALKELDYWMNVEQREERFKQKYGESLEVNSKKAPFDRVHLISATNADGTLLTDGYNYSMSAVAENITNFLADETIEVGETQAIQSYLSNTGTTVKQIGNPKDYQANFEYCVLGASTAVLPVEELTTYLAFRVFQKIDKMFTSVPSREDIERMCTDVEIDIDRLNQAFMQRAGEPLPYGWENMYDYQYDALILADQEGKGLANQLFTQFLSPAKEELLKFRRQEFGSYVTRIKEKINQMFVNAEKGPYYVANFLSSDLEASLTKQITTYLDIIEEDLRSINISIEHYKNDSFVKHREAQKAFMLFKNSKRIEYVKAREQEFYEMAVRECLLQMIEFYIELRSKIKELFDSVYAKYTENLNLMQSIFIENGKIIKLTNGEGIYKGNKYFWNIISYNEIEKIVDMELADRNADDLIEKFTAKMHSERVKWTDDDEIDIVNSFSDFLTDEFGGMISKPLQEFLEFTQKDVSVDTIIKKRIAPRLNELARENFHLDNVSDSFNFPHNGFVSVPSDSQKIVTAIDEYSKNDVSHNSFSFKKSRLKNRIFWLNMTVGVPLFCYTPLKNYEQKYESTILTAEGIGRHLFMNPDKNWIYLPSPIPQDKWGETYTNKRIKEYNDDINSLFDQAVAYKIIKMKDFDDQQTNRYEYIVTKPFHVQDYLKAEKLEFKDESVTQLQLQAAINSLKSLLELGLEVVGKENLFGSTNEKNAKINLTRAPEKVKKIKNEMKKYQEISTELDRLNVLYEKFDRQDKFVQLFIQAIVTETIKRQKDANDKLTPLFVYDNDSNEPAWDPILNVMDAKGVLEYSIFQKICEFTDRQVQLVKDKSERRKNTMFDVFESNHEKILERASEIRKQLEYDNRQNEPVYTFYLQICNTITDTLKILRG
jgi:hypothetical protein